MLGALFKNVLFQDTIADAEAFPHIERPRRLSYVSAAAVRWPTRVARPSCQSVSRDTTRRARREKFADDNRSEQTPRLDESFTPSLQQQSKGKISLLHFLHSFSLKFLVMASAVEKLVLPAAWGQRTESNDSVVTVTLCGESVLTHREPLPYGQED